MWKVLILRKRTLINTCSINLVGKLGFKAVWKNFSGSCTVSTSVKYYWRSLELCLNFNTTYSLYFIAFNAKHTGRLKFWVVMKFFGHPFRWCLPNVRNFDRGERLPALSRFAPGSVYPLSPTKKYHSQRYSWFCVSKVIKSIDFWLIFKSNVVDGETMYDRVEKKEDDDVDEDDGVDGNSEWSNIHIMSFFHDISKFLLDWVEQSLFLHLVLLWVRV